MKTIKHIQYGSPKQLEFIDAPNPTMKDDEVLIKVHYASVNPLEWSKVCGTPILMRLAKGSLAEFVCDRRIWVSI